MAELQDILKAVGLSGQGVRLGRGIVGRATHAVILLFVVIAIAAIRISADLLLWVIAAAVAVFLVYFGGVLWYGHNHTGASLLEGAELLHWQQMEMASKTGGTMPGTPSLPDPTRPTLTVGQPDLDEETA